MPARLGAGLASYAGARFPGPLCGTGGGFRGASADQSTLRRAELRRNRPAGRAPGACDRWHDHGDSDAVCPKLALLVAALLVLFTMAAYATYFERRISAWIQNRIGPNRVGP
ncbi:MAG: NADH-quinone oxidoreductase subunit H, partial [Candidatus Bipolaricaulaceae bacterium]